MKNLFFYFALILTSQLTFASDHNHMDPASVHGMVLFGEKKLYLSHLPMFHNPHDYQTVLKIELNKKAKEAYLAQKNGEELFTIVPERFILPEMVENPKPFKVTLVKGHFERGGTPFTTGVATITKVLYHKKLNPKGNMPEVYSGLLIGTKKESYILHKITGKPDFDQISKVTLPFPAKQLFDAVKKAGFLTLQVINHENDLALKTGEEHELFPLDL
ncbi:MAG: hypothetical protein KC493_12180, partial [Bacteriovoracaceae bacterium]|nr:hypothetical protein [Bacteriovoracaceae bacterium]